MNLMLSAFQYPDRKNPAFFDYKRRAKASSWFTQRAKQWGREPKDSSAGGEGPTLRGPINLSGGKWLGFEWCGLVLHEMVYDFWIAVFLRWGIDRSTWTNLQFIERSLESRLPELDRACSWPWNLWLGLRNILLGRLWHPGASYISSFLAMVCAWPRRYSALLMYTSLWTVMFQVRWRSQLYYLFWVHSRSTYF